MLYCMLSDESGFFYGRGVGRIPDIQPCPEDLRDDGVSCWSDPHIVGKYGVPKRSIYIFSAQARKVCDRARN